MATKGRPRLSPEKAYEKYLDYISSIRRNRIVNRIGVIVREESYENFRIQYNDNIRGMKPGQNVNVIKELALRSAYGGLNAMGRTGKLKPGQTVSYKHALARARDIIKGEHAALFPDYQDYSVNELAYMIMAGQIDYSSLTLRLLSRGIEYVVVDKKLISIWGSTVDENEE